MLSEPFNAVGGLTVGIPPVPVISNTGTILANINNDYILANTVLTDNLRYSNGARYVPGSNTQLVFNNSNVFGASANLTFDSTTNFLTTLNLAVTGTTNLGDVSQVSILGGENGYFLQTDGLGTLTWVAGTGGGGNGSPGGSNTQVQYNDSGSFGGDPGFTYNENTNTLAVGNVTANFIGNLNGTASLATTAITVTASSQPNITSVGVLSNLGVSGQVEAIIFQGSGANLTNLPAANVVGTIPLSINVTASSQPNITSVGTLTSLDVSGNITGANIFGSNRITAGNLFVTGNTSLGGNLSMNTGRFISNGNVNFNGPEVEIGEVSNLKIFGGFSGQVLTTDGTGNLSFTDPGGGGANPGGGNTAVQYNSGGAFGGSAFFTFNNVTNTVNVSGNLIANTIQMGSGAYKWSTSQVYFAQTASMSPNQVIYSIPVADISGVEFEIIATDAVDGSRQFCKISSIYYAGIVQFNEYASLFVNGGVGNFEVDFTAGNVVVPPSLQLLVTPSTASSVVYKMLITAYAP